MNQVSRGRSRIAKILLALTGALATPVFAQSTTFRPPAVPLVTSDPYLSIWSAADHLNDRNTSHWTGHPQSLLSVIRVDGKPFRIMGRDPHDTAAFPQVSLAVTPTSTVYQFEGAGVHVTLTFLTPLLPHDLDLMARPLTYLAWEVKSTDGQAHTVQLLDSTSSELAVENPRQAVTWARESAGDLTLLKIGSQQQHRLGNPGDDTRIDWGYAYTGARSDQSTSAIGGMKELLASFNETGKLPGDDDTRQPRPVSDDQPICAFAFDLGSVSTDPVSRQVMIAEHRLRKNRAKRIEEDDVYVKDEEDHRDDVKADIEALAGVADRHHAAFVRLFFARSGAAGTDHEGQNDVSNGEPDAHDDQQQHRQPSVARVAAGGGSLGAGREYLGKTVHFEVLEQVGNVDMNG